MAEIVVKSIDDAKRLIADNFLAPGDGSRNRELLDDAIKLIKDRAELNRQLQSGLDVNAMGGWFTLFIKDLLGAVWNGTKIEWQLNSEVITWDPETNEFNKRTN